MATQTYPDSPQREKELTARRQWFIVDAHVDLAYNALGWHRNYRRSARWIRGQEAGSSVARDAGLCSVGLPDLVCGHVGVVFGTIFMEPARHKMGDSAITYRNEKEAHQHGMEQLEFYHRWADQEDHIRVIETRKDLDDVLRSWSLGTSTSASFVQNIQAPDSQHHQVGIVPLMEGADAVLEPKELERWAERGLRIVGPAWTGTRYAGGTNEPGGFTTLGRELLSMIASLGLILDVSHLAQKALFEALEHFEGGHGHLIASHSNPQRIIPTDRHLPDEAIEQIAARGGVIGIVLFNRFLKHGWGTGSKKSEVTLDDVVRAIDHICQVTGSADHVGIGSDFDGGFGAEATPRELDTSRDLHKIGDELLRRGFAAPDAVKIMGGNWLRILGAALK
ncbi:MAG: membrane dipeptidase [Chloroflexi bacterium]|nr:membrane dipeptidase [Chloroflexota bacterium]